MPATRTQPIPIDFRNHDWDRKVLRMKRARFTHETIAHYTGLTVGQVNGRVKKGGLSRSLADRRGQSDLGRRLLARIEDDLGTVRQLRQRIRELLRSRG